MVRRWLNRLAAFALLAAIAWQGIVVWEQSNASADKRQVNTSRLISDLQDPELRSVALSSVALLAGIEFHRGQLLLGGVVGALASLVQHDTLENISSEAVPLTLTALAKLTKEHPPTASELVQLQVLPRLLTILKQGGVGPGGAAGALQP